MDVLHNRFGRREFLAGLGAVLTGGTFFAEDIGRNLEDIELSELGRAAKVVISKDGTTIIKGAGKKAEIKSRARQIETQIEKLRQQITELRTDENQKRRALDDYLLSLNVD